MCQIACNKELRSSHFFITLAALGWLTVVHVYSARDTAIHTSPDPVASDYFESRLQTYICVTPVRTQRALIAAGGPGALSALANFFWFSGV